LLFPMMKPDATASAVADDMKKLSVKEGEKSQRICSLF